MNSEYMYNWNYGNIILFFIKIKNTNLKLITTNSIVDYNMYKLLTVKCLNLAKNCLFRILFMVTSGATNGSKNIIWNLEVIILWIVRIRIC